MPRFAYYNEFEPYAADWLRGLIRAGLICDGEVDTRDLREVRPRDLEGFAQCHFFAGIGGWAQALRIVGWPDDLPVWTGSCPCQPFSAAGRRGGFSDDRDLWPYWFRLVRLSRPAILFGEQVASEELWFDRVRINLEAARYAVGASVLPACSVGAPHKRDRLWFFSRDLADTEGRGSWRRLRESGSFIDGHGAARRGGADGSRAVVDAAELGRREGIATPGVLGRRNTAAGASGSDNVDDAECARPQGHAGHGAGARRRSAAARSVAATGGALSEPGNGQLPQPLGRSQGRDGTGPVGAPLGGSMVDADQLGRARGQSSGQLGGQCRDQETGHWSDFQWAVGADGKARRVKPGVRLLVNGVSGRVVISGPGWENEVHRPGTIKGFGNAIVPDVAAEFIRASIEACADLHI